MTYFQVVPGQEVESLHMNAAISQGVPPFANAAARNAAIPAPTKGQLCYLADINQYQGWEPNAWHAIAGVMPAAAIPFPAQSAANSAVLKGGVADLFGGITYNAGTGEFTLPIPGLYQASFSVHSTNTGAVMLQGLLSADGGASVSGGTMAAPSGWGTVSTGSTLMQSVSGGTLLVLKTSIIGAASMSVDGTLTIHYAGRRT